MAAEGAVVDVPAGSPSPSSPAGGGAAPDSHARPDAGGKPAASQPETKWEDDPRVKGMLADLRKEREARQTHERKLAEYETTLTQERRRIAALAGITTPDPKDADADLIRQKLYEVVPGLEHLSSIEELQKRLEQQETAGYKKHSEGMIDQIHRGIASEFGGELTERQKQFINAYYVSLNKDYPDVHERHNSGDRTLVAAVIKDIVENMIDPVRKRATASEAARFRPVPGGRDRSTPIKGEKPKSMEDMLKQHYREHTRQG